MTIKSRLAVWVLPRSSRTGVAGMHGEAVKIRLTAPPVDGAANEELIRFLSDTLDVPRSSVSIVSGESGRSKVIEVDGMDRITLETRLLRSLKTK